MSGRFSKRVALVTGAGSGIGLGIAQRFAEEGARVAILELDRESGRKAADQIRAAGGICEFLPCDVAREDDVTHAIERVAESFGTIDHLVNNAGIVLVKPLQETTVAEWDRVMDVNVKSMFLTSKHCLALLRRSAAPTIVNIGSVSSFVGQKHTPVYVASKGAVAMLSKTLALDFAEYGIRVNCVCPGITDTPMFRQHVGKTPDSERTVRERLNRVPLGRMLSGTDIANAVLYLSGAESEGITGTTLLVDAGYLAAAEWSNR
jgi:NAD(P)-dependent dehydrogenase (short-subunit alcohol dehydrogenase family)